jgi:hypothetical protein
MQPNKALHLTATSGKKVAVFHIFVQTFMFRGVFSGGK